MFWLDAFLGARLRDNRKLVRKTLAHDVPLLVFHLVSDPSETIGFSARALSPRSRQPTLQSTFSNMPSPTYINEHY